MFLETLTLRTLLETRLGGGQLSHYGIRKGGGVMCVHIWRQTAYAERFCFYERVDFTLYLFLSASAGLLGERVPASVVLVHTLS